MLKCLFKFVHVLARTSVASNDIAYYLPEILLANKRRLTHRRIFILQVVSKIVSIRLTPKVFLSPSKVYVNQGGANWFFMNIEVNLLFYLLIRRNHLHKI